MAETVTTRFLILSDTHSINFKAVNKCGGKCHPPFPKADVALHCGDLTSVGGLAELEQFVTMMSNVDANLKLVIAGNHDMTLDPNYWKGHKARNFTEEQHERALEIMRGPLAQAAGITYLEEGLSNFTLSNGAKFTIYTSPYTPEFYDWGFPYFRHEDRFNTHEHVDKANTSIAANPIPDHGIVDIVMTHGPPQFVLDACASGNVGCSNLLRAIRRCRPRLHCFGHIHEGHGIRKIAWNEDPALIRRAAAEPIMRRENSYPGAEAYQVNYGKETLMVNAAIMNVNYHPVNAPWLLDLGMPRAH